MKKILIVLLLAAFFLVAAGAESTLAVFDFVADIEVEQDVLDYLRTGAPDLVRTVLIDYVTVVERRDISSVAKNIELELSSGLFDPEKVVEVGNAAGAKYSLMGKWTKLADILLLSIKLIDNNTLVVVYSNEKRINRDDVNGLLDLPTDLAREMLEGLNISASEISRITESKAALMSYSKAVIEYDRGNLDKASDYAKDALTEDPGFKPALAYVRGTIQELSTFGYTTKAEEIKSTVKSDSGTIILAITLAGLLMGGTAMLFGADTVTGAGIFGLVVVVGLAGWGPKLISSAKATQSIVYYIDSESGAVVNKIMYDYIQGHGNNDIVLGEITVTPDDNQKLYRADVNNRWYVTKEKSQWGAGYEGWHIEKQVYTLRYTNGNWEILRTK